MTIGHYMEYMEVKKIMKREGGNAGHVQGLMVFIEM
jgi:hypothetical protein